MRASHSVLSISTDYDTQRLNISNILRSVHCIFFVFTKLEEYQNIIVSDCLIDKKIHDVFATTIARWPKAWRVDQPVDECVYVREGRPRDPLNNTIAIPFNRL